jgi:diadenylate cyclase
LIPNSTSLLQIVILTTGIYVVLGFLRTTRGSGLVRGLGVTLLVGVVGLWGLSKYLVLEELDHIIQGITGYVVVILAILFQPELRRGIVHLGENPLLGRLLKARRREVVTEVVQAVVSMAKKRQGALIAFERKFALDAFIERAVKVDAEVNRFLVDSIFHHGSALHDGAIIIRQDRIAAASCLFPLTENIEISKSTGTRHRAALGLTEETDAVTVTVSEETGEIALSREGKMQRRVPQSKIEQVLREALGSDDGEASDAEGGRSKAPSWLRGVFTENLPRKAASIAMAIGLFWVAHQDITATQEFTLRVVGAPNETAPTETEGVLIVVLPSEDFHLVTPTADQSIIVDITGTRADVDGLGAAISGRLEFSSDPQTGVDLSFPLDEVRWSGGSFAEGLKIAWNERFPEPSLRVERVGRPKRIQLERKHLVIDSSDENPRYQHMLEQLTFRPTTIEVEGPLGAIDQLDTEELALLFEPIVLTEEDTNDWEGSIALSAALVAQGFALVGERTTVDVFLPIVPEIQDLGSGHDFDIVLVNMSGGGVDPWELVDMKARFDIKTTGILRERDSESDAYAAERQRLLGFVNDNLRVVVDAGRITDSLDSSSTTVPVEWVWSKDWREEMGVQDDPRAELSLELTSDADIKLIRREP